MESTNVRNSNLNFSPMLNNKRSNSSNKSNNNINNRAIKYYCTFTNTISDVLATRGWTEVIDDYNNNNNNKLSIVVFVIVL